MLWKCDVERMWVQVERKTDIGYIGILDNDPYCTEELKAGVAVNFGPEHVIQIQRAQAIGYHIA